ncbi:uncharacterized protein LOC142350037 isoform X3 [Convolutriloba macropyga]|uniref:uncharacterized protein LOC142350037 isoform X3 n=1 Tax=Convolutriloba macropyga TaxID=536237 RepID=UPI003F51D2E7
MSSGFGVGPSGGKNGYGQPIDQFRDEEFSGFRPTKRQSRGASIAQRISYFAADDNRMPKLFRILCCFIVLLIVLVILGFLLAKFVVFTKSDIIQTETMPQPLPQNDVTVPTISKIVDSIVSSEKLRHLPAVNSNIYPTATSEFANLNLVPSTTDHFTLKKNNVNSIENQLAKDVSVFTELSHTISVGNMTEKNSSIDPKKIDVIETIEYSSSEKEDKICETSWTSWSDCVADNLCGSGHRNRSRIDPKCEQIITSEGCSAEPCLKISDVKAGSPMSFCTKTCGGGSMLRRAACLQMDLEAALTNQKKRSLQAKVGATKYLEVDKKVCLINGIASDEDFQTSQESCCEHRCDNTKGSIFGVLSNGALTMKYTGDDSKNDPYDKQRSQFFCVNHLAVIDVGLPELADYFCNQVGYNLSYNKRSLKFVADKPVPNECSCVGGFIDVLIYKNQKSGNKTQQFDIAWTTALRFGAAHQFVTLQC